MSEELDPITFELLRHRLLAINDEATFTIMQVSANQIATDSNDLNSALMTAGGEVVVFGVWILVHSCSLNTLVQRILEDYQENPGIEPGDMFMCNDPYVTGRHQLDVVVVAPIFRDGELLAWSGTIVHQNDVGGPVAGGFAVGARNIYAEAIPMAPMKIVERGQLRRDVESEYLIRSRTPELNRLDLLAQIAANRLHGERVAELCAQYGAKVFTATLDRLLDTTEARLRRRLDALVDGRWRHVGFMEHDGVEDNVYRISLVATKIGDHLELDFTGSSDQAQGMVNAAHGTMRCFALVALLAMLGFDDLPWVPGAFEQRRHLRDPPRHGDPCPLAGGGLHERHGRRPGDPHRGAAVRGRHARRLRGMVRQGHDLGDDLRARGGVVGDRPAGRVVQLHSGRRPARWGRGSQLCGWRGHRRFASLAGCNDVEHRAQRAQLPDLLPPPLRAGGLGGAQA